MVKKCVTSFHKIVTLDVEVDEFVQVTNVQFLSFDLVVEVQNAYDA